MEKSLIESKHVQKTIPSSNSSSYSRKPMQIALHIGQKAIRQYIEKNCFNLISAFNTAELINEAIKTFKENQNSNKDNQLFIDFLFQLEPFNQIISESSSEEAQSIITNLAFNLRYEKKEKNTIIFKFGEYSEKYYILLKGKASVVVPNEEEIELSEEEYFLYLLKLRQYNENDILDKVISKNYTSYFFEEKTFDLWIKTAYNTIQLLKSNGKYRSNISPRKQSMIKSPAKRRRMSVVSNDQNGNQNKKPRRLSVYQGGHNNVYNNGGDNEKKSVFDDPEKRNLVMRLENDIVKAYQLINPSEYDYAYSIDNKRNLTNVTIEEYINRIKPSLYSYNYSVHRKKVKVTSYLIANEMNSGETFGEMMNDINQNNILNKRLVTIITNEDCDFGTLDKDGYNKCLKEVSEKMRKSKLNFLLQMKIFNKCNKNLFTKNFCNLFTKKVIHNQDALFEEGSLSDHTRIIYLIRDGEIATYCNKSINDIHSLLSTLGYESFLPTEDNEEDYVNDNEYKAFTSRKNSIKLQIFKENDILGLNDALVNDKYIYSARCISDHATVYEIHINFFKMIITLDEKIKQNVLEYEGIKRNLMIKLMLKTKKSKKEFYSYYDKSEEIPRFGCIKFNKGQKSELKDFLMKRKIKTISRNNKKTIRIIKSTSHYNSNYETPSKVEHLYLNTDSTAMSKVKQRIVFPKLNFKSIQKNTNKTQHIESLSMRTLTLGNNTKKKLLLPLRDNKILDECKTRRLLINDIPSFFDNKMSKTSTVFNMTNKELYRKKPSYK